MSVSGERLYRTEAIILKRSDVGEADRLLTVYTPARGKLRLLAKGVRKIASRKAGHVELFVHADFLVAQGHTWDIVTQAETLHAFRTLREDLWRTGYASYCAELLDRFTEEEEEGSRPLFDLALASLQRLDQEADLALVARYFELHLLALAGYQPELFHCPLCRRPLEPVINYWAPAEGGALCPRDGEGRVGAEPLSLNALKVLRFLQTREWETCRRLSLSNGLHAELEATLQRTIVYVLERNLKSAAFLHTLRRQLPARRSDQPAAAKAA
jgi:DNA repair protein RecO (recombination protein O)